MIIELFGEVGSLPFLFFIAFLLNISLSRSNDYVISEKEGSAIQFSYEEKLKLIAFTRQVAHGKYNEDKLPPLGVLDVIGRDRRLIC